ncbi:DUF2806 domain-containing protein [Flavobacterium sp. NRK F7]|uniref:DUF2806 domain-containing protein n=1 Tax=Flavobacterium sp. NRK F7 TaxID=2954930 RepID=UPI002091A01B|nr:DUF2806 domain-containing protein [Flavobacterium sp. NRK F7]MCO6162602.1 DUF2806 domain-containing protein [Flavobacterium sp. NRK F7]
MTDPKSLLTAIESASRVANTNLFTTIIDKAVGFRLSKWAAEGEVRKKIIHDEYEKAKDNGIIGMQYIEYMRSTENLINIAVKSTKYIDERKPNDIKIDNDFFWNTIDHAKTVSNEEMQELIAKIIAGEYNKPGTYSMRTLQTLKMLGKSELELFEKVCVLCINDYMIPEQIFFNSESYFNQIDLEGIHYGIFQELQTLGLILPNTMSQEISNLDKKKVLVRYFDKRMIFEALTNNFNIRFPGFYELSTIGKQISEHLNPKYNPMYFQWLNENFKISNYKLVDSQQIKK